MFEALSTSCRRQQQCFLLLFWLCFSKSWSWTSSYPVKANSDSQKPGQPVSSGSSSMSRRDLAAVSTTLIAPLIFPDVTTAATGSLAERLSKRDPSALTNSVFNLPPPAQLYPPFMRGSWDVTLKYGGYLFPSQKVPRDKLTADFQIPGFQKCSIASLADVGKEVVRYTMSIDDASGMEDRCTSLSTSINGHLGYPAVQEVLYSPKVNPNRLSIVFYEYKTTNAERIELFCNGRESELIRRDDIQSNIFVCSEYIRQVTFGTGSDVGVPRQVGTNYAHFWTWKQPFGSGQDGPSSSISGSKDNNNSNTIMTGNLLTAAYLDPQDSLFFEEPSKPVAIYSHVISATRL
jgi:hypothetical protein